MNSVLAEPELKKKYSVTPGWRVASICFLSMFLLLACLETYKAVHHSWDISLSNWLMVFCWLLNGTSWINLHLPYSVTLEQSSITTRSLFGKRTIPFEQIRGQRGQSSGDFGSTRLVQVSEREPDLVLPHRFNFDYAWNEWISSLPDIEEQNKAAYRQKLVEASSLGSTPQARLHKREWAGILTIALSVLALAAGLTAGFGQKQISVLALQILIVFLGLLPWAAIALTRIWPLLFSFTGESGQQSNPFALLFLPCVTLLNAPYDNFRLDQPIFLVGVSLLPALLLALCAFRAFSRLPRPKYSLVFLFLFCWLYGIGLCLKINTVFDHTSPELYVRQAEAEWTKHPSDDNRYVRIPSWANSATKDEIRVTEPIYELARNTGNVCVSRHTGVLRIKWYTLFWCSSVKASDKHPADYRPEQ